MCFIKMHFFAHRLVQQVGANVQERLLKQLLLGFKDFVVVTCALAKLRDDVFSALGCCSLTLEMTRRRKVQWSRG